MNDITAAVRNGSEDLESLVRPRIIEGFERLEARSATTGAAAAAGAARGPRRSQVRGMEMRRSQLPEISQRNHELAQMVRPDDHRAILVDAAVDEACAMLEVLALTYADAALAITQAEADLKQIELEQRPAFERALQARVELTAAKDKATQLADQRHEEERTAARAARAAEQQARPRPTESAIPQTEIASSSTGDAESRQMKLRGDIDLHSEAAELAQREIEQLDEQLAQADDDVRQAEEALEAASAAQAGRTAAARRRHAAERAQLSQLRRELAQLDTDIAQARSALISAPSRQALISDRAWERAIERHVEPDDTALRARARYTGHAGAYTSRADLAQASADIHAHLLQQPGFQAVLAARSRADFERAAAALPDGVTDLIHDHGRPVGRGFSNDLDQTERATTVTQSNFSLQFVQGRVVISHLYPYVPHRQLTTA